MNRVNYKQVLEVLNDLRCVLDEAHSRRLYHGTTTTFLDSIKSKGLAGTPTQDLHTGTEKSIEGWVYLTTEVIVAREYARKAVSKFGGEELILVFEVDPSDKRLVADEDWISKVTGMFHDAGIADYGSKLYEHLSDLYALALGDNSYIQGSRKGMSNDTPEARELFDKVVINMDFYKRSLNTLGEAMRVSSQLISKGHESVADELYDAWKEDGVLDKKLGEIKKRFSKLFEKLASKLSPHPHIPIERVMEFAISGVYETIMSQASKSKGVRAKTWLTLRDQLERDWSEWFDHEAALVSQHTGRSKTVAMIAPHLKPKEAYKLPQRKDAKTGPRKYRSGWDRMETYSQLHGRGHQVIP